MVPPLVYVWFIVWIKSNPENAIDLLRGIASWKRERRQKIRKKYGEIRTNAFENRARKIMLSEGYEEKYINKAFKVMRKETERKFGEKEAELIMGASDDMENFF